MIAKRLIKALNDLKIEVKFPIKDEYKEAVNKYKIIK